MEQHLERLNDAQRHAVTTEADVVQVLAPPGSGKTKTLTSRVAHLLRRRRYRPWNVICLTFTVKSAREMKDRLCRLIGDELGGRVILGTFHSVCVRYLRSYGHLIGLPKRFAVADASDTTAIIDRILKRLKLGLDPKRARSQISNCKSKNVSPGQLQQELAGSKRPPAAAAAAVIEKQELVTLYEEYELHLRQSSLLDYDDLLVRTVELLRLHPACVSNVQAVLIDEFQDTNFVQFDLMRLYAQHCNCVTTVGDPDQSIYGWRNAEVTNLSKMYEFWPDTSVINLEENYRSTASILQSAQKVIDQDTHRPQKQLVATHRQGKSPVLRHLPTPAIEAQWIVSEIRRFTSLSAGLFNHADFAILLRSAPLSRHIEGAMGSAGIPYRMVGGKRFFDRLEVKILLDYLRVVAQPDNSDALARIINVPSRRIGDTTIKGLLEEAATRGCTLWTVMNRFVQGASKLTIRVTSAQSQGMASLCALIQKARKSLESEDGGATPKTLLELVVRRLDFKEYLAKEHKEDHELRWDNVEQLMQQADDPSYAASNAVSDEEALPELEDVEQLESDGALEGLSKFLANVALATEVQAEQKDEHGNARNMVTISTMHAAKGLEWPIVFIPACYKGSIPHSRAADTDEERRLLYVAMTRAQAMLYMSIPKRGLDSNENETSPFLAEGKVKSSLDSNGPLLDYTVIEDMAAILDRPPPTRHKIASAVADCKQLLDDRWPLDGSYDAEEQAKQWVGMSNSYGYRTAQEGFKRRKVSGEGEGDNGKVTTMYNKTTMQAGQNFTVPATVGFTSASHQMELQKQCEEQQRAQNPPKAENPPKSAKSSKAPDPPTLRREGSSSSSTSHRTTKRPANQSSLLGWFGNTAKKAEPEPEPVAKDESPQTDGRAAVPEQHGKLIDVATSSDLGQVKTEPVDTKVSHPEPQPAPAIKPFRPVMPAGATADMRRPLQDKTGAQDPKRGYRFVSSSPPPDTEPMRRSSNSSSSKENALTTVPLAEPAQKHATRPVTTLHRTTVGRFTHGNVNAMPSPSSSSTSQTGQAPRRRLGIRGPMKPWGS